jgi:hypothetical protein
MLFDDVIDDKLLEMMKRTKIELDNLVELLDQEAIAGESLIINRDDSEALVIAKQLLDLYERLKDPETLVNGLRKLCSHSGVDLADV